MSEFNSGIPNDEYLEWRSPRFGKANPEVVESKVWEFIIRESLDAWSVKEEFDGPDSIDAGPVWCFSRNGQTSTQLPDGTIVWIAGEHEDFYDPDFYIYNDVVVTSPDGKISIFNYPKEVFPQTDFHSATRIEKQIWIIGNLGYPDDRKPGFTQVYRLDLESYSIEQVETSGENPGWIHEHEAFYDRAKHSILIKGGQVELKDTTLKDNIDEWSLDLTTGLWSRLTSRNWTQIEFTRKDGEPSSLWQLRMASAYSESDIDMKPDPETKDMFEVAGIDVEKYYKVSNYQKKLLNKIYQFSFNHSQIKVDEESGTEFEIFVDGIKVRFDEGLDSLKVTIEGELAPSIVKEITSHLTQTLSNLEKAPYEADIL